MIVFVVAKYCMTLKINSYCKSFEVGNQFAKLFHVEQLVPIISNYNEDPRHHIKKFSVTQFDCWLITYLIPGKTCSNIIYKQMNVLLG